MILYHGSYTEIANPDVVHSRKNVDFGPGFYTTPLREQAEKWCKRFADQGKDAIVFRTQKVIDECLCFEKGERL